MCCRPRLSTGGSTASLSGSCFTVIKTGILVCQSYLSLYLSYACFIAIPLDTPGPYRLLPASKLTVGLPVRSGDKSNGSLRCASNRQCAGQIVKKGGVYEEIVTRLGDLVRHLWRRDRCSEYKHGDKGGTDLAERDRRETRPGHHRLPNQERSLQER